MKCEILGAIYKVCLYKREVVSDATETTSNSLTNSASQRCSMTRGLKLSPRGFESI